MITIYLLKWSIASGNAVVHGHSIVQGQLSADEAKNIVYDMLCDMHGKANFVLSDAELYLLDATVTIPTVL